MAPQASWTQVGGPKPGPSQKFEIPKNPKNDTSVDPKQQYISRLSKTCMYKTAWQTKEETSARHSTSYTAMSGRVSC